MGHDPSAREILEKLVSFPTISSESNLDLIEYLRGCLLGWGIESHLVHDDSGTKANLHALVGPRVEGGVILSGHTDVVPVEGQSWTSDPFRLVARDGRLYGRGTCDMKGFDALALWAMQLAAARKLRRPLILALSHDEEVGCLGAPRMIDRIIATHPAAAAVIVGEPSMMKVVTGHKGAVGFSTHVRGYEVHSSLVHTGVSAVMTAARLVEWLRQRLVENMNAPVAPADAPFDPPFTTLHVGTIHGGTAGNITARDCEFLTDIRCPPAQDPQEWLARYMAEVARVEAEIRAIHPEARITVTPRMANPPLRPESNGAAERLARRLTGDNGVHVVSYGTEAGQFQERGHSVVVCGPGDIAQAHQPDEFIALQQFESGAEFMRRLIDHLAGDGG